LEAVLIHKHRARLSPRLIPGFLPSQCVALVQWYSPIKKARDVIFTAEASIDFD